MKSRKLKLVTLLISYRIRDVFDVSTCYNRSPTLFLFPRQNPFKFQCLVVFFKVLFDSKLNQHFSVFFCCCRCPCSRIKQKTAQPSYTCRICFYFCQRVYIPNVPLPSLGFPCYCCLSNEFDTQIKKYHTTRYHPLCV